MARRRVISAELLTDEEYNSLGIEAQLLFLRMLVLSDDYGIVPANEFRLGSMLNLPSPIRDKLKPLLDEILSKRLGFLITVEGKSFFAFKPVSFRHWQAQLLSRRQKSEYLRMNGEEVESVLNEYLQGFLKDFGSVPMTSQVNIESREKRVASREQQEESKEKSVASKKIKAEGHSSSLPVKVSEIKQVESTYRQNYQMRSPNTGHGREYRCECGEIEYESNRAFHEAQCPKYKPASSEFLNDIFKQMPWHSEKEQRAS